MIYDKGLKIKPRTKTVSMLVYEGKHFWVVRCYYRGKVLGGHSRKGKMQAMKIAETRALQQGFTHAKITEASNWSNETTYRINLRSD